MVFLLSNRRMESELFGPNRTKNKTKQQTFENLLKLIDLLPLISRNEVGHGCDLGVALIAMCERMGGWDRTFNK